MHSMYIDVEKEHTSVIRRYRLDPDNILFFFAVELNSTGLEHSEETGLLDIMNLPWLRGVTKHKPKQNICRKGEVKSKVGFIALI